MCETIVVIVGFLFWMLHGLIFYKINQFYPDQKPETEQVSVNLPAQSPEEGALPRDDQKIAIISRPDRQSAASFDSCCPSLGKNPENMKIRHSMVTENGTQDYAEILDEEHRAVYQEMLKLQQNYQQLSFILEEMKCENDKLKQEVFSSRWTAELEQEKQPEITEAQLEKESELMNDNEILKTKLNSLCDEIRKITDAKEAAEKSAQEEKSLVECHLTTIAMLQSEVEYTNKIIGEKTLANDQLNDELADYEKLVAAMDKQNIRMKMDMKRLNESVRKRKSDWRSSEKKLVESNEDLKKKLDRLQTDHQKLLESNSLVKTELDSANKEIKDLRENIAAKEHDAIDFRKEIVETLRAESERMVKSCKVASLSPQTTEEHDIKNQQVPGCSAQLSSSQSDNDISQRSSEEIIELETQLRDICTENQKLTSAIDAMHQAEKESQKTMKMMEYQLYWNTMKQARLIAIQRTEALMAAQKPVQTLKEVETETSGAAESAKIDEMGSTDLLQTNAEEASGTIEAEKIEEMDSPELIQKNADGIAFKKVVTEESSVAEAKNIEPVSSADLKQKNTADIKKRKNAFKVKRWLQKWVFRKSKIATA